MKRFFGTALAFVVLVAGAYVVRRALIRRVPVARSSATSPSSAPGTDVGNAATPALRSQRSVVQLPMINMERPPKDSRRGTAVPLPTPQR